MAFCVFCNVQQNLNTQFKISLEDGTSVAVDICDAHAEDATVKKAKDAYLLRQKQIEDIMKQAAALGLNVGEAAPGKLSTVTTVAPTPGEKAQQAQAAPSLEEVKADGSVVVPLSTYRAKGIRANVTMSPNVKLEGHSSFDTGSIAEDIGDGEAEINIVQCRDGMPVAIPKTIRDGTGTTRIKIVDTGGDQALQRRFRSLNDNPGSGSEYNYRDPVRICPACKGDGVLRTRGNPVICPKCQGEGQVAIG